MQKKEMDSTRKNLINAGAASIFMILVGQYTQHRLDANGNHIYPQIVRHHLSNAFDGAAGTAVYTYLTKRIADKLNQISNGIPQFKQDILQLNWTKAAVLGTTLSLTHGIHYEIQTAQELDQNGNPRHYDWVDTALYIPSSLAMLGAVIYWARKEEEFEISNFEQEIKNSEPEI